jgi:hypothetical protein
MRATAFYQSLSEEGRAEDAEGEAPREEAKKKASSDFEHGSG